MKKRLSHWLYAIAAMLIYAQSATLLHALEHELHTASEICAVYSVVEHNSADNKIFPVPVDFSTDSNSLHEQVYSVNILSTETRLYSIRSPPSFFLS